MITNLTYKQIRVFVLPIFESLNGRSVLKCLLRDVLIVQVAVALEGCRQILARVKAMRGQDLADAPVEALDHAVGLRMAHRGKAVLDTELVAELVKAMGTAGLAVFALQSVGEGLVIVGEQPMDAKRCLLTHGLEKGAGRAGGFVRLELEVNPAARPIDGHKQILARRLIGHLREVFVVDMDIAWRIGLKGLARALCLLSRAQIRQTADPMAAQAAIQSRAGDAWIEELAHHDQQIIEWQLQCAAQFHGDGLLRRAQRS